MSIEMSTVRYIYINIYEYKHDYEYEDYPHTLWCRARSLLFLRRTARDGFGDALRHTPETLFKTLFLTLPGTLPGTL